MIVTPTFKVQQDGIIRNNEGRCSEGLVGG
jgi:hypothetical protein